MSDREKYVIIEKGEIDPAYYIGEYAAHNWLRDRFFVTLDLGFGEDIPPTASPEFISELDLRLYRLVPIEYPIQEFLDGYRRERDAERREKQLKHEVEVHKDNLVDVARQLAEGKVPLESLKKATSEFEAASTALWLYREGRKKK